MSGFDLNQLTITGNLVRDPELRNLPSGQAVCNIRIAHNERRKNSAGDWSDSPAYFDVTIWSGLGEYLAKNLTKGQKVVVAGRLKWREYEGSDGEKRQVVDITADSVIPIPRNGTTTPQPDFEPSAADRAADDDIPF